LNQTEGRELKRRVYELEGWMLRFRDDLEVLRVEVQKLHALRASEQAAALTKRGPGRPRKENDRS